MKYGFLSAVCGSVMLAASGSAFAADLPVKAPLAAVMATTWTGFYIGGNVGYSWGKGDTDFYQPHSPVNGRSFALSGSQDLDGVIGGGQIGFNWHSDKGWIFGLEADFQGSGE